MWRSRYCTKAKNERSVMFRILTGVRDTFLGEIDPKQYEQSARRGKQSDPFVKDDGGRAWLSEGKVYKVVCLYGAKLPYDPVPEKKAKRGSKYP